MTIETLLFLFFSLILIFSSLLTVTATNTIYSILFLILNFLTSVGLLFLLECEFMGLIFLIIYVGAIAVLFLFIVMMLDIKLIVTTKDLIKYIPIGSFLGLILLFEVLNIILKTFSINYYQKNFLINMYFNWYEKIDLIFSVKTLGNVLYTHYLIQFLISGFILLLAIIGSVILTMDMTNVNYNKQQFFFRQISRNSNNILLK